MKELKSIILLLICIHTYLNLDAVPRTRVNNIPLPQPPTAASLEKLHVFGLIRIDSDWKSRQMAGFIPNALTFFAKPYIPDAQACDINNCSQFCITPANSGLGVDVGTFRIGRANIVGRIFGAFSGFGASSSGLFTVEQAYVQAQWPNTTILVGEDFHPFTSKVTHPIVVSANAGAPFAPLANVPQIHLTYRIGNLSISPTIWAEFVTGSDGPQSWSAIYFINSGQPAFNCMLEYETDKVAAGVGINIKQLLPELFSEIGGALGAAPKRYVSRATITSFVATAYLNLQLPHFAALAQITGGQNATDLFLLGGYGVAKISRKTNKKCFANTQFVSVWAEADFETKAHLKPGLFVGYTCNFGTHHKKLPLGLTNNVDECTQPQVYGADRITGFDSDTLTFVDNFVRRVDHTMRVSPYLRFITEPVELGLEAEIDHTVFGLYDNHAKVVQKKPVTCLHLTGVASYYF